MIADAHTRVRRSIMLTPGHQEKRLAKAAGLPVDCVAFDLEDAVPPQQKAAARRAVSEALTRLDFGRRERIVRINAVGTVHLLDDLMALPLKAIDCLFVPKVGAARDVALIEDILAPIEAAAGLASPLPLILTIETGRGLFNAAEIATSSRRAVALFFGSGDYSAETGGRLTPEALQVPRGLIAAAAGMAGLQAIDAAYFRDVKNAEATRADALLARDHGFQGKVVFHPDQVAVVNDVFTPTPDEVARAERIIKGFEEAVARGEGTAIVDGQFVAIDILPPLRRILAVARHAGVTAARP